MDRKRDLLDILIALLPVAFARQGFLGPLLLTRFQIERVSLDFLDDVFLLHFTLETAERAFERLTVLYVYFCQ